MQEKIELLLLVVAANAAPILVDDLIGRRWAWPLDGGLSWVDGRRLLGSSATVRGVVAAAVSAAALAWVLGHSPTLGAVIGLTAMMGDAVSSFVKRRLGLEPGDRAPGLDQVPESLAPLLAVARPFALGWLDVALLTLAFTLFSMSASRLLYRLRLRKRPY